jgi:peroxiredoxin
MAGQVGQQRRAQPSRWVKSMSVLAVVAVAGLIAWGLLVSRPGAGAGGIPDFYGLAGRAAPNFTLSAVSSVPISLSDFRGQRVLLNFWYVACPNCATEMPDLERFYTQAASQHIVILGINIEDDAQSAAQFMQRLGITYPVALDTQQHVFDDLYHLTSTPSSIFVDSAGVIRGSVSGPLNTGQLQTYFNALR